jgi:hypothetical protein
VIDTRVLAPGAKDPDAGETEKKPICFTLHVDVEADGFFNVT